jgi:flavin reductase ActVB
MSDPSHDAVAAPVAGSAFREALSRFASGVVVVAAAGPAGPAGFTASAFSSVSLDPPLVLVCIGRSSSAYSVIVAAPRFGISVLSDEQEWVAAQFARKGVDRFAGVPLAGPASVPWVAGALAFLDCERAALHGAGDHSILVGRVIEARATPGRPLVHYARAFGRFDNGGPPPRAQGTQIQARRES